MCPTATARTASRVLPFGVPQLHVGTDICHVARVYAILKKARPASPLSSSISSPSSSPPPTQTTASRFIRRVLTPSEVDALGSPRTPPSPSPSQASTTMSAHTAVALLARGASVSDLVSETAETAETSVETSPLWRAAQYLASRFAAKEAAIKAHPHLPGLTLQDVRIARRPASQQTGGISRTGDAIATGDDVVRRRNANSGPPLAYVRVYSLETDDGIVEQEARISISHDGEYATAVCLGVEHPL
ncbi:uncharacterized protein SPSK_05551 [Sporothrix schenckii 1099-18]|uniref:Uncharacterized protein n=2 Tax=Sporothrix schenckii TaxID=29908 RepID=U7Q3T9_SPOS1|nr:uncharacterized protein SPSK_05551 [Sporothrix schenckii 1099-18]ERT02549.1 hypothetical protein HMPREF1624_00849 [Sporothrix schenckii ATCC 58251]KJR80162.1 hypothetical protein SPSK_05551 [Sporothrix schenckii 1099-18]